MKEHGHGDTESWLVERGQPGISEEDHVQHQQCSTKVEQEFCRVVSPQLSKRNGKVHRVVIAGLMLGAFTCAK